MKPDWKDVPEWANWLAMDADGGWYWHEDEPVMDAVGAQFLSDGRILLIDGSGQDWSDSLEQRHK